MKKKILAILGMVAILSLMVVNVAALKLGDVVNFTRYTDIIATINGYDIEAFNMEGYTYVVAEDLRNYGFYVEWNAEERALYITRNYDLNMITSRYITTRVPEELIASRALDVYYTDIKTYINGYLVQSHNIGGETIIFFEDLRGFGTVSYSEAARRISLNIPDMVKPGTVEERILSGDISDFSGVYRNGYGDTFDLRHDGTEGYWYDGNRLIKENAHNITKDSEGSYGWGVDNDVYDAQYMVGYAVYLYPAGVPVLDYYGYEIPSDTTQPRLYITNFWPENADDVYYLVK